MQAKKRVLIVDDDERFGRRAVRVLEKNGFVAHFHRGPRGALEAMQRNTYDAVLLDVNMPQINGPSLLRMLGDSHQMGRVRIILCSDMRFETLQLLAQRFGADHALQKPEDPEQLARDLLALWTTPSLKSDHGVRTSSFPPALTTRRKHSAFTISEPASLPSDLRVDHEISIEPPDLVVVRGHSNFTDATVTRIEAWAEVRPYFLILLDLSEDVAFHVAAREQLGEWARRMPPHAIAAFGSSFHLRIVFEMLQRATSRLGGQPVHRYFAPNETAARAWLSEIRPNLSNDWSSRDAL